MDSRFNREKPALDDNYANKETLSYGAIATYLGAARSARMVGWAMNNSHNLEDIPAHRVVNRKGILTGKHHFEGTNLMQQLLENEGVVVINNQIQNFEKIFWCPTKELK